jgi:hypothetical protein
MPIWPFDRKQTEPALGERVAQLEKQVKALTLEWDEWYDKYRRLYARIAKRQERDEAVEPESREDAPEPTNGHRAVSGGPHPRRNY